MENMLLPVFSEKTDFTVSMEKCDFLVLAKMSFYDFGKKKLYLSVLARKNNFIVLVEKHDFLV